MSDWEIAPYRTAAGRSPVEEYVDALSADDAARVEHELDLLSEFGTALGMPHVRPVGRDVWELRIRGRLQHRVMYVALAGRRMLLLHAFTKKTEKTPAREIKVALDRLVEHRGRFGT